MVDSMLDRGTLCIAHGSPPGPLSQPSHASSQPVTKARTRLAAVTRRFANRFILDTQLRTAYLAECKRCIQSLPTLFQQDQPDERETRNLADGSSNKIITMQGLIGVGTVPTFHKLISGIRGYGGAEIQHLLHTDFTRQGDVEKQAICLKLINNLAPKHSELRGSNGLHKAERWLRFMTACLVWTLDAGRMAEALSWQPEINQASPTRPIGQKPEKFPPRPIPAPRARLSTSPPQVNEETLDQVDQNEQAATLEQAAKDGTPFCEECEKERRRQEAEAQAAA